MPAVIYQPYVFQHKTKLYEPWALPCEVSYKPFLVSLVVYKYLWKAYVLAPASIETLGATAVITMIILTSDVTSAGFFFNLSDVSNYAVFQVGKKETQPPKSAKIPLRNETKVICSLQPLFTCFFLVLPEVESISASSIE